MGSVQDRKETEPRVIAIGGSADGLLGLTTILQAFPRELPAAVVIAQHVRRGRKSLLVTEPFDDDDVDRPAPHEAVR